MTLYCSNHHEVPSLLYSFLVLGMDGLTAYTKKDVKTLIGSTELRRQIKLPKAMLGYCTPLALETNGK
jgi:hypothetical protein